MSTRSSIAVGSVFLVIVLGLASGIIFAADPVAEARWPSLGGGYQRTGRSSHAGPLTGDLKWRFETGGAVISSMTVGADGRTHIACEDGILYTLDAGGEVLWTLDVNTPLLSAPSIGPDGRLHVGGRDGRLYAVDPNGHLRWTCTTGDAIYSSPAVGADGEVYVGSTDGSLYALSRDGAERWRFRTGGPGVLPAGAILASPAIGADGTVYVAGLYDPNLYALNPADGSVKWVCRFPPNSNDPNTGGWPFAAPVVADDGTIYQVLLYDQHLYAIEPADGAIRWSVDLCRHDLFGADANVPVDSDGWSEPVLGPDGTIYVSLDDPYLRAIDPAGTVKWVKRLGEVGGFTMVVDKAGVVYAAGDDGFIYVVAPDGSELIPHQTDGWPAYPVIAADGLLLVADAKDYSSLEQGAKNVVWAIDTRDMEYPR